MKHFIIIFLTLFFALTLPAQSLKLDWGYANGSTGADAAYKIAVDAAGNTYATGSFTGTVDFDTGPGIANLSTATGQTKTDAYILKLDVAGNYVWAISIGGTNDADQSGRNIALDSAGNVVVSGFFYGNIMMPPNTTNYNSALTEMGTFLVKVDTAGTVLWGTAWASATGNAANLEHMKIANNTIVLAGTFTGSYNFSNVAPANYKTSNGGQDLAIVKVSPNGQYVSVATGGGVHDEIIYAMENSGSNYYFLGPYKGTVDFNFGSGVDTLKSTNTTFNDQYILIVDSNLGYINALSYGGSAGYEYPKEAVIHNGFIYVSGLFKGATDFDPSPTNVHTLSSVNLYQDSYLLKLTTSGNFVWVKRIGTNSLDVRGLAVNSAGDVFIGAMFAWTIDVDPGPGTHMVTAAANPANLIIQYKPNGDFRAAYNFTGASQSYWAMRGLTCDAQNRLTMMGHFNTSLDLDPGPNTTLVTNAGDADLMVLRFYNCRDTVFNVSRTACHNYLLSNGQVISQSGLYTDTVKSAVGCDSIFNINLTINPLPNTTIVLQNGILALANSVPTNMHQWINCTTGQIITGATGTGYTPTANGGYAVIVSDSNCTDTSTCFVVNDINIAENELAKNTILYPNPTSGLLQIDCPQMWQQVQITDLTGRTLISQRGSSETLDLSALPTGVYVVKLLFENGVVTQKVVKE